MPSAGETVGTRNDGELPITVATTIRHVNLRALVIALTALGILVILLVAMRELVRPIAIVIAGITVAEAFVPLVTRLERRMPRTIAVLLIYLGVLAVLGGLGWIVVPRAATEAQSFAADVPALIESLQDEVDAWDPFGEGRVMEMIQTRLGESAGSFADLPLAIVNSGFELFLIVAISIYWLIGAPELLRFVLSLVPNERRHHVECVLSEMGQSMGGYVRGTAIISLIVGTLAYAGLAIIGVQFALVLAIIAGLLEIVPVIGPIIAGVPMVAVALTQSFTTALIVLGFWIVMQQLENYLIAPNIVKRQTDIPELVVIIAIFAGGTVGGILGALVAIPVSGALKVLIVRVVAPAIRRWSGAEPELASRET